MGYFELWDVGDMLPAWCATPEHWIEPTPPSGFVEHPTTPPASGEQYYKKVPTLHMSGSGRHIVPSAQKPQVIARVVFVPVKDPAPTVTYTVRLHHEADLVPFGKVLFLGKIALEEARALLGCVVQSSTEPRTDSNAPPAKKRRKVTVIKFMAKSLDIAWGLEVDSEGTPTWLHCVPYGSLGLYEYVLGPLSGEEREYEEDPYSPLAMSEKKCAWVGVVELPADRRAKGTGGALVTAAKGRRLRPKLGCRFAIGM